MSALITDVMLSTDNVIQNIVDTRQIFVERMNEPLHTY